MTDELEYAEDLGHPDQPDHLSGFADDVKFAQVVHDEVDEVWEDCEQVDQVHGLNEELQLLGGTGQSHKVLNGEVDCREVIHVENDVRDSAAIWVLLVFA